MDWDGKDKQTMPFPYHLLQGVHLCLEMWEMIVVAYRLSNNNPEAGHAEGI